MKNIHSNIYKPLFLAFILFSIFFKQDIIAQRVYQLKAGTFCPPPSGSGTLSGKVCFDVAISNDNTNGCGALSWRTAQKSDFTLPATHTQTYTFNPSGTVSNVRFVYLNTNGNVIIGSSGGNSGDNISANVTVTINYNTNLNTLATGLIEISALTADIYAIYNINAVNDNNPANDRSVKLSVRVKDCVCCGANSYINDVTGGPVKWLQFMCHNLGSNESLDPFTHVAGNANGTGGTRGYLYQWGRPTDGHQFRNSTTTETLSIDDPPGHGDFIISIGGASADWFDGGGNNYRWGDITTNQYNTPKGRNDPCPSGFKVPSRAQWNSIVSGANTETWITNGYKIGDNLFLPAAGSRTGTGTLSNVGTEGLYWSSTPTAFLPTSDASNALRFTSTSSPSSGNLRDRILGLAVRCVVE